MRSTGAPPLFAISGLSHRFGERAALVDFNLELGQGEIVGLLGPNGSGKSTLMSLLCGLQALQAGVLSLRGERIVPASTSFREACGVVFQSPSVDARLSVLENLELAASARGYFGEAARHRVSAMLELTGLGQRSNDVVGKLSGGYRRRVDLARALIHSPSLLLMDEPTTGLDESAFRELWVRLLSARDRTGLTILVATHRADEAERCDRLVVLDRGRTVTVCTPLELASRVHGDLVVIECDDLVSGKDRLSAAFPTTAIESAPSGGALSFRIDRGHEAIPRAVDALRGLDVRSVSLRRPSLSDAFLAVTGQSLEGTP
ncbi:MAG: ABC transporter ATP-binding protein [Myxococcales bacterium]|nr:ABC transporter ATP-binding protein [Myxococcales bacterium]